VYSTYDAVVTKRDQHGVDVSSVSAPHIQALMLEQPRIEPGMSVLEIGSGGYNAALLAEVVGDGGHVVTVDIDAEVAQRARMFLDATGYARIVGPSGYQTGTPPRWREGPVKWLRTSAERWNTPALAGRTIDR
jgi:protein-L-isoaspartate(D-aspartate) O-methyltransferase